MIRTKQISQPTSRSLGDARKIGFQSGKRNVAGRFNRSKYLRNSGEVSGTGVGSDHRQPIYDQPKGYCY